MNPSPYAYPGMIWTRQYIGNNLKDFQDKLIDEVGTTYGVTRDQLIRNGRHRRIVDARHVTMYLLKKLTPMNLRQIGEILGDRNHTTVIHATKKIEGLIETDHDTAFRVGVITKNILNRHAI